MFVVSLSIFSPIQAQAAPPDAPVISSVFARVNGLDVSFTPATGITYQVKVSASGNQVAASASGLTTSPVRVNGLSASTDYTVELIATNSTNESSSTSTSARTYQSIRLDFQFTSVTSDGSNLSVAFAVNPDYTYALIWDGTVMRTGIKSSPQTVSNWPSGRTVQLGIVDAYGNYGYSNPTLPTVTAPTPVNQATLTINPVSAMIVGGTASLSTSGGSGTGAVSYSSSTTSICTISGTTLSAVSAGTCSISATKASDSSFNAASATLSVLISDPVAAKQDQATFSINLISTLTVGGTASLATSGGSGTGSVTYSSSTTSVCTISGTTLTAVGAGTCSISATKAGDNSFNSANATASLVVGNAIPTKIDPPPIAISMKDLVVGETSQINMVGINVGPASKTYATLTPTVCSLSGLIVTALSVGTCTLSGTRLEDATYNALTATKSVQVTAPLVDTAPPALNNFSIAVTPAAVYENGTFSLSVPITDATGVASASVTISRSSLSTNYSVGDTG